MTQETQTAETAQAAPAQEAQQQQPDLTLADLAGLKSIIDVAAQRGAFKPNEMQAVGTVYNKLSSFLSAASGNKGEQ